MLGRTELAVRLAAREVEVDRAQAALKDVPVTIGVITHPSPANPKANKGWEAAITKEFKEMGVRG